MLLFIAEKKVLYKRVGGRIMFHTFPQGWPYFL
jgi:hypothetical protein